MFFYFWVFLGCANAALRAMSEDNDTNGSILGAFFKGLGLGFLIEVGFWVLMISWL